METLIMTIIAMGTNGIYEISIQTVIEDQNTLPAFPSYSHDIILHRLINETYISNQISYQSKRKFGRISPYERSLTPEVYEPSTFSLEILKTHSKNIDSHQKTIHHEPGNVN